jgi:hypothetical protein
MAIVIDEFASVLHANARDKGFWDDNNGTIFYQKLPFNFFHFFF